MSTHRPGSAGEGVPALFRGLLDDAAVFPPGNESLPEAVAGHRVHHASWYSEMVGPLLIPASIAGALDSVPVQDLPVGIVGDTGLARLPGVLAAIGSRVAVRQVEIAVAKRGEDPQPGLAQLIDLLTATSGVTGYAEIPLTFGLIGALDTLATARAQGVDIAAKFRTGGLAAELFPTPIELAAVICACRDRDLPFKLTAGLHQAMRHADPETGFVHHGFLGVLGGTLAAVLDDAEVAEVAALLASVDPVPLVEAVRRRLDRPRPLWVGFGTCSIDEPLADLRRLGLLPGVSETDGAAA